MDQTFFDDIATYKAACVKLEELSAQLKPWVDYKDQLVAYIIARHFRDYTTGIHTVSLPDGSVVEFAKKENVAINEDLLPVVFDKMVGINRVDGVAISDEQVKTLNQLYKLVRWSPALDKRQYDKLPDAAKAIFEHALRRTPAKPSLTLKDKS